MAFWHRSYFVLAFQVELFQRRRVAGVARAERYRRGQVDRRLILEVDPWDRIHQASRDNGLEDVWPVVPGVDVDDLVGAVSSQDA